MALVGAGYRWSEGGWFKESDGSGPYTIDSVGNAYLMSGAAQSDNAAMVANSAQQVGGVVDSTVGGVNVSSAGRFGSLVVDLVRRLIIKPLGHTQTQANGRSALSTGDTAILAAPGAAIRHDLHVITFVNRDTVDHTAYIKDGTTVIWSISAKAGDSNSVHFSAGFSQPTQNTAINATILEAITTTAPEISIISYRSKG